MAKVMEEVTQQHKPVNKTDQYPTKTLLKVWFRLFGRIISRLITRIWKTLPLSLVILVAILALLYAAANKLNHNAPNSSVPFTKNLINSANFSIYYPKNMQIDESSIQFKPSTHLLIYTVHNGVELFYVSVQPRPNGFSFDSFNKQISDSTQFITSNGTATVGKLSGRQVGSLLTTGSWILVSTTLNTPTQDLGNLLRQLTVIAK
jgi:hypothetical protein